jgi:predicted secreted Zn-dependent protease
MGIVVRSFLKIALTPFLLVPAGAQAVQKCVAADGSVSYVDVCPSGTTRAPATTDKVLIPKPSGTLPRKPAAPAAPAAKTARPAPASPEAPYVKDVAHVYYDVDAPSFAAAREAVAGRATGPVQAAWKMSYEYQVRQSAGRCSLGTIATKLDLTLTLPRWKAPDGAAREDAERWREYVETLRLGEYPRFAHARSFEQSLPAELLALPAAESCNAFEAAMRSRYDALREQAQARFAGHPQDRKQ